MANILVDIEVAAKEVAAWLDFKRVKAAKREAYKANIDALAYAISVGDISIDEKTFVITQKLCVPVDGLYNELCYKPRITVGDLQKHSAASKAQTLDNAIVAAVAALTDKSVSHIQKMDTEDYAIAAAIGVFFI